jgi:hypothetical protein
MARAHINRMLAMRVRTSLAIWLSVHSKARYRRSLAAARISAFRAQAYHRHVCQGV